MILSAVIVMIAACSSPESRELKKAQAEAARGFHRTSLTYYDNVLIRAPESPSALIAAREAARISMLDLKDYQKAIYFNRHLVRYSPDADERLTAQKQIAALYFDHLQDYTQAVVEFGRLLATPLPFAEKTGYQLAATRSNYYIGRFDQAESEIDRLLNERLDEPTRFAALTLRGNILVARKDFAKAVETYRTIIREFPAKAKEENVALSLAVCYEENGDFKNSIAVLEGLRGTYKTPEYIDLRIHRLKEREKNRPGAKGLGRK